MSRHCHAHNFNQKWKKKFHHVVHGKVGRGIEFEPLPVITSIQNGGSKLTPDAIFWREAPRVVVAKNKFDIWNRLDLRIKNIYTFVPFCKKKKNWKRYCRYGDSNPRLPTSGTHDCLGQKKIWKMTEYINFGLPNLFFIEGINTYLVIKTTIWFPK